MVGCEDNEVVFEKCDNVRMIRVALSRAREWSFYLAGLSLFFFLLSTAYFTMTLLQLVACETVLLKAIPKKSRVQPH